MDIPQLLNRSPWFRGLPAPLQEALIEKGNRVSLQPGDRLFSRGDAPCGVYAVLSGSVRIVGIGGNGKEAVLTLIEPPQWFGEITLFDGGLRTHDAQAESDCVLWKLSQRHLEALLAQCPDYWRNFAQLLTEKLRMAFIAIEDVALLPAPARLARRLLMLYDSRRESGHPEPETFLLSQEVLGGMLGISRQTTNQILREFEAKGLLEVGRGKLTLRNTEALNALSNPA